MAGEQNPPGKLTGHDMNTIAAQVLASRGTCSRPAGSVPAPWPAPARPGCQARRQREARSHCYESQTGPNAGIPRCSRPWTTFQVRVLFEMQITASAPEVM
jgi:hypothetical protein